MYIPNSFTSFKITSSVDYDNGKSLDSTILELTNHNLFKVSKVYELINKITDEAFVPLSYGGGITTIEEIQKILSIGCEKIILNSVIFRNMDLIKDAGNSIVASGGNAIVPPIILYH